MGAQSNVSSRRKSYDPAAVYDPTARRRKSPTKATTLPTRFPDEDHSYQPLRRLQVAKLQQNALPPPSPVSTLTAASPRTSQKKRQRIANIADSQLWGFPVKYSPAQELSDHWEHAMVDESTEGERLLREEREERQRVERERVQAELSCQDYSLYLYVSSKYGALDAILYCSTPFPGRLYALLIDQSVRKLQKWRRERLLALRRYWIVTLAREAVDTSFQGGLSQIQLVMEHQRKAATFLKRLRWRFAASAFRSWFEFTQRQVEVRWRFQFSLQESLRSRFVQWRERVAQIKEFKMQLKQVARRKRMHAALDQWRDWQFKQHKLRVHLQQQWTKLQRECFAQWALYSRRCKTQRLAASRIQSQWRGSIQRRRYKQYRNAARTITRVVRGFLARRFVSKLWVQMDVAHAMERILRTLEWEAIFPGLRHVRHDAVKHELLRAERLADFVTEAATQATQFVKSELDKVRKNATHQQLQEKLRWLQDEAEPGEHGADRGPRTQEILVQRATQLLLDEAAAMAQQRAGIEFLSQRDTLGTLCNLSEAQDLECVVCRANASALVTLSVPWIQPAPPCIHVKAIRTIRTTDLEGLRQIYSKILEEFSLRDVETHQQLSTETTHISPFELRKSSASKSRPLVSRGYPGKYRFLW